MPKRSPEYKIEEYPGNQYKSLEEAQKDALSNLAETMSATILRLLMTGKLVSDGGIIRPFRDGDAPLVDKYLQALVVVEKPISTTSSATSSTARPGILKDISWIDIECDVYFLILSILELAEIKKLDVTRRAYFNQYGHIEIVLWAVKKKDIVIYSQETGKEGKTKNWQGYEKLHSVLSFLKNYDEE